jgi:tRNA1(Val) A37 N6-methylase TrmN6
LSDLLPTTQDTLLNGRLSLLQPAHGHRAGTDAMLVLATAGSAETVLDLGAGVGTIGLAMLALGRAQRAVLVENEPATAELARRNIVLNRRADAATLIETDLTISTRRLDAAGLPERVADLVVMNPPYNSPGRHRNAPDMQRRAAHAMDEALLADWLKTAATRLRPRGRLALIHRPESLPWLLPTLARRFGDVQIRPVHPRAAEPASRVLITASIGTKAPAGLLPALVLFDENGNPTAMGRAIHAAETVLSNSRR